MPDRRLEYFVSRWTKERNVRLDGEAYFEVAKNPSKPFIVQCKDYAVKVLGLRLTWIVTRETKLLKQTLATGKVEIDMDGKQTILNPGQQAIIKDGEVNVKEVDVEVYTTWMYENFRFKSESIQEIMNVLSSTDKMTYTMNGKILWSHFPNEQMLNL